MSAALKQKAPFDNVNVEWNLTHDEGSTDFSDDETVIEDRVCINSLISHIQLSPLMNCLSVMVFLEWMYYA